jgi:hypothetical protein
MNWELWARLEDNNTPRDCMDRRHCEMVKAMLIGEAPSSIVEIGCCNGLSTTAVCEAAIDQPKIKAFTMCDPRVTLGMLWVASYIMRAGPVVDIHAGPSCTFKGTPDCWLIDGDHIHGALFDYEMARQRGAKIVTVHDSHNADEVRHWGAVEIANRLKRDCKYFWHDAKQRDGELTERGMSFGFFYEPSKDTIAALDAIAAR